MKVRQNGHRARDSFLKLKLLLRGERIRITYRDKARLNMVLRKG